MSKVWGGPTPYEGVSDHQVQGPLLQGYQDAMHGPAMRLYLMGKDLLASVPHEGDCIHWSCAPGDASCDCIREAAGIVLAEFEAGIREIDA